MAFLWLGVVAGLASSPHCIGMCGPFSLHLAAGRSQPIVRYLAFLVGKTSSYAFLGALAGFLGQAVLDSGRGAVWQSAFSVTLGGVMFAAGIAMLGVKAPPRPPVLLERLWGAMHPLYQALLAAPGALGALLLGTGAGFLPCPATFALCAAAAAGHSTIHGLLLLAGLGVGTGPALLAVGLSGEVVGGRFRRLGLRGVGAVVALVGVTMVLRPTGLLCALIPGKGLAESAYGAAGSIREAHAGAQAGLDRGEKP